ncbi:MAG: nuclear transport factor 2 family protein [Dehalococcoidia bacterium]|nr:nuclear transport factor 2 family protein [Dehalococcoidia bacterium]
MIASWIMKRIVRSVFDKAGAKGDAEGAYANAVDDITYDIPLELSEGGTVRSKKQVLDWYHKWYEQFPKRKLIVRNIAFAAWPLSPRNVLMVEWTCEETDKEGKEYKYDGAAVTDIRNGKGVRTTEYIACKGLPKLSTLIKPTAKV